MSSPANLAAAVISEARNACLKTAAEFDYHIAVHGIGGPNGELGQACYAVATQHLPADATTEAREAAWMQLWTDLQPELVAYEQRCRDRRYTGWSYASRGPIRYAS